ncbi:MAG: aldo/keto reductase [Bryobacteraceae bacterium]|jgi:aryl-alcohol dehydrogenase-like predicted oxidoreductase
MPMNRRSFLQTAYGTAGAAFLTTLGRPEWLRGATPRKANDVLYLGEDKIKVTRMAIGLGTNAGNVQREMGLQGAADYLKFAFDQGQFFWDTGDAYKTHFHIRQALKSVPREKVTILTKSDVRTTAADMKVALDRYRQELGTDYIDIVLLHGMHTPNWPTEMQGIMDVLSEAKEKGTIRTHGVSIHSLDALKTAAKTPWCKVHLQGINVAGVRMDSTNVAEVVAVLRQSKAAGKGVLGMKILGEGRLRNRIDETLSFVLGLDCLDCFTIGAANRDELADLIRRMPAASQAA